MAISLATRLRSTAESLLNLLYPPHCDICMCETEAGEHLCTRCRKEASRIAAPFCQVCSAPFEGRIDSPLTCFNCRERKFQFESAISPYRSQGVVRETIHRFKYQRKFHLRHVLAEWLADGLTDPRLQSHAVNRLVPVPLHPARERERGFNQAHVLASLLSRKTAIPVYNALKRIRFTPTQTKFDRDARMENLRNAFSIRQSTPVQNLHLLLVDDVLTTGSTVDECARVLIQAGAASVRVATVARG